MANFRNTRQLPSRGTPGDIIRDCNSGVVYLCVGDGSLVNLADLLSEARPTVRVVGPAGERGPQGPPGDFLDSAQLAARVASLEHLYTDLTARIERGDESIRGPAGRDGQSIVGPQGPAGDCLYAGPAEMLAAVKHAREILISQRARFIAAVEQAMADAGTLTHARKKHFQLLLEQMRQNAGL